MADRKTKTDQAKDAAGTPSESAKATDAADAETATAAAPIEAPEQRQQRTPHLGVDETSTNPLAANAALRSVTGSTHLRLLTDAESGSDEQYQPLSLQDIFAFPESGSPSTVATVKTRVYEEYTYPNTTTPTRHLLYPKGARVPVAEARRVLETYKHADDSEKPAGV